MCKQFFEIIHNKRINYSYQGENENWNCYLYLLDILIYQASGKSKKEAKLKVNYKAMKELC